MRCIIRKCVSIKPLCRPFICPVCSIRKFPGLLENLLKSRLYLIFRSIYSHFTGSEVDCSAYRTVAAADIQHQTIIDVKPHIIIAVKFVDDFVSMFITAVVPLNKLRLHGHSEEIALIVVCRALCYFI